MNWYHAVSKDLCALAVPTAAPAALQAAACLPRSPHSPARSVHWAHLPIALTPDSPMDCGGEFSGSATVLPDAAGTPVLSVSVACGKWVFFAIPVDKAADPLMIHWKKNGAISLGRVCHFDRK
jgi:hypothetical protein